MEPSKKTLKCQKDLKNINVELEKRIENLIIQQEKYLDMKLDYSRCEDDTTIAKSEFQLLKSQLQIKFEELRNQEEYIRDEEKTIQRLTFLTKRQQSFLKTQTNLDKANQMLLLNKINLENNISKIFEIGGGFNWKIFDKVLSPKLIINHEECDIEYGKFNLISDWESFRRNNENKKSSVLSYLVEEDVNFQEPTHHEFYVFIKRILLDIIKLCDYQNELKVNLKRRESLTPHYLEITDSSNTILGFVEICFDATDNPYKAAGHCFDFALQKNTTGHVSKKEQFIICMSNKDARVFFTNDSKELAADTIESTSTTLTSTLTSTYETTSTNNNNHHYYYYYYDNRVLFSSHVVSYNSPNDLFNLLCSAIIKMNTCKHHRLSTNSTNEKSLNSPSITNETTVQATTTSTTTTTTTTTTNSTTTPSKISNKKNKRNQETTPDTPKQRRRVSALFKQKDF
ncbi:hypothetical protein ACTFIZ_012260 [Dictyostelium cf. discoideum]